MAENKIKPVMDEAFFNQPFHETNVGFRADMMQNSLSQSIQRTKIESQIRDFVPNDEWRENVMKASEKAGYLTLDDESAAFLKAEFAKGERGKVSEKSNVEDILDFLEEKREQQQKWRERLLDLPEELADRYQSRLGFWARDNNVRGYFNGETPEDQQFRLSNVQYSKEQNLDGINKRLQEYQREYEKIFGEKDANFDVNSKTDAEKEVILNAFYNQFLRSEEYEKKQFERMLTNQGNLVDYDAHPEAARYQFLEQIYHNPEMADANVAEIIKAIKNDESIPKEEKIKAFLTVSDNNLVRDNMLDPKDALYYNPNFHFTYEKEVAILQEAGLLKKEHEDTIFNTLYSDPLKSISLSLPIDLQEKFNKVIEAYEKAVNQNLSIGDTKGLSIDKKEIDVICEQIPDKDLQERFRDICHELEIKVPDYLSTLKEAAKYADESQLNNLQLSKINNATDHMLNTGRNAENTMELTNNHTLGNNQELRNDLEHKYKNQFTSPKPQLKHH